MVRKDFHRTGTATVFERAETDDELDAVSQVCVATPTSTQETRSGGKLGMGTWRISWAWLWYPLAHMGSGDAGGLCQAAAPASE